jgi:hypothetical protein
MDRRWNPKNRVRIMGASAIAGFLAPLVFFATIGLRKVNLRAKFFARGWTKRMQREISRWT